MAMFFSDLVILFINTDSWRSLHFGSWLLQFAAVISFSAPKRCRGARAIVNISILLGTYPDIFPGRAIGGNRS